MGLMLSFFEKHKGLSPRADSPRDPPGLTHRLTQTQTHPDPHSPRTLHLLSSIESSLLCWMSHWLEGGWTETSTTVTLHQQIGKKVTIKMQTQKILRAGTEIDCWAGNEATSRAV